VGWWRAFGIISVSPSVAFSILDYRVWEGGRVERRVKKVRNRYKLQREKPGEK
jgi:hypothetical protein